MATSFLGFKFIDNLKTLFYKRNKNLVDRCMIKRRIFSMLCNMHSKLIPTDHIYIHKYRNVLSVDTFLNAPHTLKKFVDCMSYTIMLK